MRVTPLLAALFVASCASPRERPARPFRLHVEGNASFQERNDVRIPNDSEGDRFALDELAGSGPYAAGRVHLDWDVDGSNQFRFVVAPLRSQGTGQFDGDVDFAGETFAASTDTLARYQFDTYRLTWRWLMNRREDFLWRLGATLLVRDAEVELEQAGVRSSDDNVGLVPLLHVAAEQRLAERWWLVGDFDGAIASQGRAFDLSLGARYRAGEDWDVTLGYRVLDGGADNDEVFSFATFHSVVLAVGWSF